MQNWIALSIAAGLVAAICYGSIAALPPLLAFFLFYLSSLPLFMVGLWIGAVAAGLGGIVGAVAIAVAAGILPAAVFVATAVAAPTIVSHFALKSRAAGETEGEEGELRDRDIEWYPEGRLVLMISGLAAALVIGTVVILGPGAESFVKQLKDAVEPMIKAQIEAGAAQDPEQLRVIFDAGIRFFPFMASAVWIIIFLANFGLSIKILNAWKLSQRPWTTFGRLQFPRASGLLLTGSVILAFFPGTIGYIGLILCGAFFTAFAILGLAVLHGLLFDHSLRGLLLGALYVSLFVLNGLLLPPLVLVALADMMFDMRRKLFNNTGSNTGT